jgi:hypothetical protein
MGAARLVGAARSVGDSSSEGDSHWVQVSHPLLRLMYGGYWFRLSRLSMMVIGSFASYTKTKSVESAV